MKGEIKLHTDLNSWQEDKLVAYRQHGKVVGPFTYPPKR